MHVLTPGEETWFFKCHTSFIHAIYCLFRNHVWRSFTQTKKTYTCKWRKPFILYVVRLKAPTPWEPIWPIYSVYTSTKLSFFKTFINSIITTLKYFCINHGEQRLLFSIWNHNKCLSFSASFEYICYGSTAIIIFVFLSLQGSSLDVKIGLL